MNIKKISNRLSDSSNKEQFVMDLIVSKKKKCPKTGMWEIKGNSLYHDGKKVKDLAGNVSTAVKQIMSEMKVKDSVEDAPEWPENGYIYSDYANVGMPSYELLDGVMSKEDYDKVSEAFYKELNRVAAEQWEKDVRDYPEGYFSEEELESKSLDDLIKETLSDEEKLDDIGLVYAEQSEECSSFVSNHEPVDDDEGVEGILYWAVPVEISTGKVWVGSSGV